MLSPDLENYENFPKPAETSDDLGLEGSESRLTGGNILTFVPLAPRPQMSATELVAHYFPGTPTEQLETIVATDKWLEDTLRRSKDYDDQHDRLMVLLTKARTHLADSEPGVESAITNTTGVYVERYGPLLVSIAAKKNHPQLRLELDDLLVQGQIGLLQALNGFDLASENSFLTYANYKILGSILDELRDNGSTIRIPRSVLKLKNRLENKDPMLVGKEREIALKAVAELSLMKVVSLDGITNWEGEPLAFNIADPNHVEEDDRQDRATELDADQILALLPFRYRAVVQMYLGIGPYTHSYTIKEIGDQIGVTESRISQMMGRAWTHLEHKLTKKNIST